MDRGKMRKRKPSCGSEEDLAVVCAVCARVCVCVSVYTCEDARTGTREQDDDDDDEEKKKRIAMREDDDRR